MELFITISAQRAHETLETQGIRDQYLTDTWLEQMVLDAVTHNGHLREFTVSKMNTN